MLISFAMTVLVSAAEDNAKFVERKLKEMEVVNLDFKGQTMFEKIDEGVVYFNNPLLVEEEEERSAEVLAINRKLIRARADEETLVLKKRRLMDVNKEKLENVRLLMHKINELD